MALNNIGLQFADEGDIVSVIAYNNIIILYNEAKQANTELTNRNQEHKAARERLIAENLSLTNENQIIRITNTQLAAENQRLTTALENNRKNNITGKRKFLNI